MNPDPTTHDCKPSADPVQQSEKLKNVNNQLDVLNTCSPVTHDHANEIHTHTKPMLSISECCCETQWFHLMELNYVNFQ